MEKIFYISAGFAGGDGSKDKPFGSFPEARDSIRALRADGTIGADDAVTVLVRQGEYDFVETFLLDERDAGREGAPMTYKACDGEKVVISGGRTLPSERFYRPDAAAVAAVAKKYPEAADFVNDYPAHYRDHPSKDVSGEVKKGVVPLFIQWDERWGYEDYGGNYFAVNGCGPTCLSMVVCGLTGETDANPYAVACYSEEQGYYTPGSGTSWALMTRGAAHYGLDAARVDVSADAITGALAQGRVIIASMKPGDFTYTGHFIVLTGLDRDGRVRVNDSNSRINSAKSWDAQVLVDQMKGAWSYSYNE